MSTNEKLVWGFRGAMIVAAVSVFLPWIRAAFGPFTASAAGIENWRGVLAFLCAVAGGTLSFFAVPALANVEKPVLAGLGGAVAFFALVYWLYVESFVSFGAILCLLCGIAAAVLAGMVDWPDVRRKRVRVSVEPDDRPAPPSDATGESRPSD